jgi:4-amino-4-deoxy-L-arabinose transferase-like glycosyltransferase
MTIPAASPATVRDPVRPPRKLILAPWHLILGAIIIIALGLRLYGLDSYSLWMDEVDSIAMAQRGIGAIFTDRFGFYANQTPWHYLLVWLTIQPIDPATTSVLVRLPSALAGALLVPVVFALGQELFGRTAGLLAAVLTLCSTTLLGVAQDARPYALLALLSVLSVYCFQMAQRTERGFWWVAWAAATVANILNSYTVLTLVMPALVPYWILLLLLPGSRPQNRRSRLYATAAAVGIGLVAGAALLELSRLDKVGPDLTQLRSMGSTARTVLEDWLAQANIPFALGLRLQEALGVTAGVGVVAGLWGKARERRGVVLCVLLLLVPLAEISALGTTNTVSARYVGFMLPFYYLLIGRGFRFLVGGLIARPQHARGVWVLARVGSAFMVLAAVAVLDLFAYGGGQYYTARGQSATRYKPDFRAAAAYLAGHVQPADTIVFIDDPPHGMDVSRFYWHGHPPATVYDARDPRLANDVPQGEVYWVVGLFYYDQSRLDALAAQGWAASARFYSVVVLREPPAPTAMVDRLDRVVSKLEALDRFSPVIRTVRSSIYQDRGQVDQALRIYAGPAGHIGFLGPEHLQTAMGFARLGNSARAWQQAMLGKYNQADSPDLHRWLAQMFAVEGYVAASRAEARIAAALVLARPPAPLMAGRANIILDRDR